MHKRTRARCINIAHGCSQHNTFSFINACSAGATRAVPQQVNGVHAFKHHVHISCVGMIEERSYKAMPMRQHTKAQHSNPHTHAQREGKTYSVRNSTRVTKRVNYWDVWSCCHLQSTHIFPPHSRIMPMISGCGMADLILSARTYSFFSAYNVT